MKAGKVIFLYATILNEYYSTFLRQSKATTRITQCFFPGCITETKVLLFPEENKRDKSNLGSVEKDTQCHINPESNVFRDDQNPGRRADIMFK